MKLREIYFTSEQIAHLEDLGLDFSLDLMSFDNKEGVRLPILDLNKWDINDMNKCLAEYLSHKGEVFDKAIDVFGRCSTSEFISSYILTKYPDSDLLDYEDYYYYEKFVGFTSTRKSTRDGDLLNFLVKFNHYSRSIKCGIHAEEYNNCIFRITRCW